jgi:hypothetical protein
MYRFVYTKCVWGGGVETRHENREETKEKRREFSIPRFAKYKDVLSLAKSRAFSCHHQLPGPKESREKWEHRSSSRLEHSLEMNVWHIVLCSALHAGRGTDFVTLDCILETATRMQRALSGMSQEK